jgi:MSHA pilin protein MshD
MCSDPLSARACRQSGISLIEVILFIVIVSVGVIGLMSVLNSSLLRSADPMLRKQALAVAEALLEEVEAMPFTDCDPDFFDPSTGICTLVEAMGIEAGEVRGALATPFDNVNDYNGFTLVGGGTDIGGVVAVPAGYNATVAVAHDAAFGAAGAFLPAADVLRISVTVTYNGGNDTITLAGYRTRYAPNDMP